MRKITITYQNVAQFEKRVLVRRMKSRKNAVPRRLACAKCDAKLKIGDAAYRTSRRFYCESCGSNSEID